jgi:plasmid stabilization system protein ParE
MTYRTLVRPEAAGDVQEAFEWYEQRDKGLGFEFLRATEICVEEVKRNPIAFARIHRDVRRVLLRKFPYALFYVVDDDLITFLACFHAKRNPTDWMLRL